MIIQIINDYFGIFLGVISIIATVYYARKYSEKKEPAFSHVTYKVIQRTKDAPQAIDVLYDNKKVERIYSTKIWFWNSGRKPIIKDDLPQSQPLRLIFSNKEALEILNISLIKESRKNISFKAVKVNNNEIELYFDFLDKNDGCVFEVLHTGDYSTQIEFSGVILGVPNGIKAIDLNKRSVLSLFPVNISSRGISRKKSVFIKLFLTLIFVSLFGGLAYYFFTSHEITTTKELLVKSLTPYIPTDKMSIVINSIIDNSKYKFLLPIVQYLVGIFMILNLIIGCIGLWRKSSPYPKSLYLYESDTPNGKNNTNDLKQTIL